MNLRPAPPRPLPLRPSDLRGLYRLGVDGSVGLTDLVEAMHHTITSRIGFDRALPIGRSSGITGVVYGAVRGGMQGCRPRRRCGAAPGRNDRAPRMRRLRPSAMPSSPRSTACSATTWSDSGNPLAIRMALRSGGLALPLERAALAQALPDAGAQAAGAGARPVHERPAMDAPRPRPRPGAGPGAGLHAAVPALQQRPACLAERPRVRGAAAAAAAGLAGAGGRTGDRGPQHGRAGRAQRLPPGRAAGPGLAARA